MAFDYKAFAENQKKLWTGLQVNELLKGPFTAPWERYPIKTVLDSAQSFEDFLVGVMNMRKKYIPVSIGRLTGKSWMATVIDERFPVQPAAPVMVANVEVDSTPAWRKMQDAYERRKHRR